MKWIYAKFMKFLAKGNKWQFDIPVEEQLNFIRRFPKPKTDIQRSFFQYKSQMFFESKIKRIIKNTFSILVIPIVAIVAFCKRVGVKHKYDVQGILEKVNRNGMVPDSINNEFLLSCKEWASGISLGYRDIPYCMRLIPYIFYSPYFVLKCIYKLALYSTMIKSFSPKVIVVFNEYSFTSSLLTGYCEFNQLSHYNIMHGEKLYYIRDSFFRFSRCYVWDEYYIKLFTIMYAPKEQFIVEAPPFMNILPEKYKDSSTYADYKYYLASYNEEELKSILQSLNFIKENGKTLKLRPHPHYSDIRLLKKYVNDENIEYPENVNIETSISNLEYGIGVYTTVLNQCYRAQKKVIIDDVNFPDKFSQLSELGYVLINKELPLLSEYQ